jgi:F-type H+-transporting ATPase subunit epsilon
MPIEEAMRRSVRCVVVTPERAVLDETVDFVAVPLYDGELGVLPGRLPLIGRLGYGELRLVQGPRTRRFYIDGGFVQVRDNVVTILTPRALSAEDIRVDKARDLLQPAGIATTPEAQAAQEQQQKRARAQLRIARHTGAA